MKDAGRTAPSVTGPAHPGTLLSALLAWLDARSHGHRFLVRLEDTDHTRVRPGMADALLRDFEWLGIDWDAVETQSQRRSVHEQALDELATLGLLYPCVCSRADIRRQAKPAPGGGYAYGNTCRHERLPPSGWRGVSGAGGAVRLRLPDQAISLVDEGGLDLSQAPALEMGDPVLVRRDGALAYQLVSVVDDAHSRVVRIVRGRDIAPLTGTQVALQRLLGLEQPSYRHHLLLLETQGRKLAKLHGSVSAEQLRTRYSAESLCGLLAHAVGLTSAADPIGTRELLADFQWTTVSPDDLLAKWTGQELLITPVPLS